MLGYEPYEMPPVYETWSTLLHPDDRDITEQKIREHVEKCEAFEEEFRLRTKSGEWRWILGRGKVVEIDGLGQPVRMLGTHVDITERKQTERRDPTVK